ncbi:MAG: chemotaxis protein CheD [Desulfobacteraceae bacterium]
MATDTKEPRVRDYLLKPGYIYLPEESTAISAVLGSSVSVTLFDTKLKTGGMNHFLYPEIHQKGSTTSLYGNVAVITLIDMILAWGSSKKHLQAQIFGGAFNTEYSDRDIGADNIETAKRVLKRKGITVVSEDVGGMMGRKVVFNSHDSEIALLKVSRLRQSDWYPYEGDR